MNIETVKVHHPENKRLGWHIINKSKFDPAIHKIWTDGDGEQDESPSAEPKKRGRPAKGQD